MGRLHCLHVCNHVKRCPVPKSEQSEVYKREKKILFSVQRYGLRFGGEKNVKNENRDKTNDPKIQIR